ncbi:MAG: UDP-glucose 4-epimerase GalE [Bryobacteraceae bacterium]
MSQSSSSPTVLVAGGAGYIGSHTAKALAQAGLQPVILDNLCTGNRFALQFGPFYEGSIADAGLVQEIVRRHRPLGAILFAGHAYVGESTANPRKYFNNNVIEAIHFLNHLLDAGDLPHVVFSSSCSVYGIQSEIPISENSARDPLSPYAETKAFLEKVLRWYGSAYGLRSACLRYFNAAGADPDGQLGEHHDPETHLIPLAIQAAMGKERLRVFGTDYATPDGTAIRDYIHVSDLADGHVRALRRLIDGSESFTLNLGTGTGYSVRDVIRAVERTAGVPVPVEYGPRREGDAPELVADPTLARNMLGWTPRHSSLETIVQTAWNWYTRQEAPAVTVPLSSS